MRTNLLFTDRPFDPAAPPCAQHQELLVDLDLPTLLAAMSAGDRFLHEIAQTVLLTPLTDAAQIRHRQQVLDDCLRNPGTTRDLYATVAAAAADRQGMWGLGWQRPASILAGALAQLEAYVKPLHRLRRIADEHAPAFRSTGMTSLFEELRAQLDDAYFDRMVLALQQLHFPHGQLLSARLGPDNGGIEHVLRIARRPQSWWRNRLGMDEPGSHHFDVNVRDDAGAQALEDITGRGLNEVASAVARSADHVRAYFTALQAELGFYVGCLNLHDALGARGAPITFPVAESSGTDSFACAELCDPALRLRVGATVVGNDVAGDAHRLVVITGANSGGKSTFLRSVGTAQLMMQAGMFVVAREYRSSIATGLFTHFVRDEDPTMQHGRLDGELVRMSSIADQVRRGGIVLFNESFAATNEREGSEIAGQVVRGLVEAGIRVFFVTHQFDFADGCRRQHPQDALFLRAERRRDFKLVAADPLATSFGADLFDQLGGWSTKVH